MKKYNCPICKKDSAYVSEYGLADSVICKCQGLEEVGRLVNGQYQPHNLASKNSSAPSQSISHSLNTFQSQGRASRVLPGMSGQFVAGSFIVTKLTSDQEVARVGVEFHNALSNDSFRAKYMSEGSIWVARHQQDENRSIVFYIRDSNKALENFYLKRNAKPADSDRDTVVGELRKHGLISN